MHALYDVTALAQLSHGGFGIVGNIPLAVTDLLGDAEPLEGAEAADLEGVKFIRLLAGARREIYNTAFVAIAPELAVEIGPAFGLDLTFQRAADIVLVTRAQFLGDEITRPVAHALTDIVAGDDEVLAIVPHTPHDQVDMWMLGVPVVDGDPIEPGVEISLHLPDQVTGEGAQVGHLDRIVRRDDEAEMMAVVLAALGKGLCIGVACLGPEEPGLLPVLGDAFTAQIGEMGRQVAAAQVHAHDTRLDDGAA